MSGEAVVKKQSAAEVLRGVWLRIWSFIRSNYAYILAFLLPAVILFVAYIIFRVWPFGDRSVLSLDLNAQYVYYYDYMYDVFAGEESLFYSWSRNLSGEFAGIIGYYLASPFNLLVWIWDRNWITEGLMTMMLAKAAASGLTMCFLLKKHRGYSDITALVFSVMYALCGFFVVQTMDPMWLDGIVALPLVAMGVERICDKRRFKLYVISLVYIFIANFYIGYMIGIFSALYFLYYLASGKSRNVYFGEYCGAVLMYGAASVSAILMSCVMILPVYKSLSNGKFDFSGKPDYSLFENFDIADIFIKLFPTTYDTVRMEGMPALYAGTLALVFMVIYFLTRKFSARERIAGGVLIGVLVLCMYIRPVDMMWHGGQMPNWLPYRYSFVLSFLMVLFGAQAFDRIKSVRGRSFGAAFGILLAMLLYADLGNDSAYYDAVLTIAIPLAVLAMICIIAYVFRKYADSTGMKITVCTLVCLECLLNTSMSLYQMHGDIVFSNRDTYRWDIPYTREVTEQVHELDDSFYRMEKTYHRCVNDPIALQMYGMSHSSSTLNATAIRLLKYLGYTSREHYSRYDGATVLTDDIFGVKYILAKDEKTLPYTETFPVGSDQGISAYINDDALGFAYLADSSVAELDIDPYVITPAEEAEARENKESSEEQYFPIEQPFLLQNELAKSLAGGEQEDIFLPVTDITFDSENIRLGTTTDAHHSHRKKDEEDEAWISWEITAHADGPVYMYLPTIYERETQLYINEEYRGNYYLYENYSIEYLGTYAEGESFTVKLKLLDSAVYFKEAQFYYADMAALEQFSDAMAQRNSETALERTDGDSLKLSVNAVEDSVLFTTIPMEEGWTVLIDGEEVPLIATMEDSLIAVNVPAGKHEIRLDFFPAGMKAGIVLTVCGALMFAIMMIVLRIMVRAENARKEEISE